MEFALMNTFNRGRLVSFLVATLAACAIFPAVGDDGKPRYVAGGGRDTGDCTNRFRPCRTLSYAISQAGKGDKVQVAEGTYTVADARQLYDVVSMNGRIAAGFSKVSGYSEKGASGGALLIGVPPEFRARFEAAGFTVIADTKGLDISAEEAARMAKLTAQITATEASHSAAPCSAGISSGFPCQSVSLATHVPFANMVPVSTRGNDVWGFTDLNTGREYALMGLENGVAIVDVTNPDAPEQIGFATGSTTTWRDMEVYQRYDATARRWRAYAYATADAVQDFLIVIDMSGLPNSVTKVNYSSDFRNAHTTYLANADYMYGLQAGAVAPVLGVAGSGVQLGNFRLYSLADPRSPSLLSVGNAGYAHDLASYPISDARKNTQCVNAASAPQCQVLSDFNENTLDIWDVTNPAQPAMLSSQTYPNARYVHSGWWTEDARFLFVHDELDEQNFGLNTTVRVFDMSNLRAPTLAGSWVGPTRAIDHNGYAKGNRYYFSNYSEGLTVLDITDPRVPTRVGYFDTFPTSQATGFVGAWSAYPFFESSTVAIADINTGLYLVRDETLASPRGTFTIARAQVAGTEGQTVAVTVNRSSGTGAVSVELDALYATASASDANVSATTLNWADGDTQPKSVVVTLASDSEAENLELLFLHLKNPVGGATIGYPNIARVTVADAGAAASLRAIDLAPSVSESVRQARIVVSRQKSASGEARVSYRTVSGSYSGMIATQGELVWADGDSTGKTIPVSLTSGALGAATSATFQVELFGAVNATLEDANGATVTTLPVTVTVTPQWLAAVVVPNPTPTPLPTPDRPRSGGGGGAIGVVALAFLALLAVAARQLARRRVV